MKLTKKLSIAKTKKNNGNNNDNNNVIIKSDKLSRKLQQIDLRNNGKDNEEVDEVKVNDEGKSLTKTNKNNLKKEKLKKNKNEISGEKGSKKIGQRKKGDDGSEHENGNAGSSGDDVHENLSRGSGGDNKNSVGVNGGDHSDVDDDVYNSAEESDSSEDEVGPRNTIGNVPLEFYRDEEHIGYEITGKKIKKKERQDLLQKYLSSADDKNAWRKIIDEYNDEEVHLTKDEIKIIRRILKGKTPHADADPYPDYVDWFEWEDKGHPLSNAPEPKRRFLPSKWEHKKIVKLIRAIRDGRITFDKPKEEPKFYLLWGDDSGSTANDRGLAFIPPPKVKLPGHEESYNPSLEYLPTQEEIDSYQEMYEEDRPKFIPKRFTSLRCVPAYENAVKERFERCLDLYLCPRLRKKRINVDPESLKPKLPNTNDLKPFPTTCYIEYKGHTDAVVSISAESSGQWIASGSTDGTVRVWEVATGRCIHSWEVGADIRQVAWNPVHSILAISVGQDVLIVNIGLGTEEEQKNVKELLHIERAIAPDESGNTAIVSWLPNDKHGGVRLKHFKTVSNIEWHRKGDYLSTVMPAAQSRAILIHQLSKKVSQKIPFKLHGLPVCASFHPSRSVFFISTKKIVRVYDLAKEKLIKKLETGLREVSRIAIHPGGDNIIVGSKEGKLSWFDMDYQSRPYRTLKVHPKDITNVAFHHSYPLFASCSEDSTARVFHGMVYSDLNQNPLIVGLKELQHSSSGKSRGVLDCAFHPRQPWLFTAGADSVIKLFCH